MTSERPTVRPVTLARLVEVTHLCESKSRPTEAIETELDITHRRARESILEAVRVGLLEERPSDSEEIQYRSTDIGDEFVDAVRRGDWLRLSHILENNSPHYRALLRTLETVESATLAEILDQLNQAKDPPYTFNQTSVEVLGDWGERLKILQRNAFTGDYYLVRNGDVPPDFPHSILTVFEGLEETAGVNLRQRYISIPELREHTCERLSVPRSIFDAALIRLVNENIGKVELSGAPIDTAAKDAKLGIKEIELAEEGGLVSTSHSTNRVMAGVEQFDKQYYYLAVYDRDLKFPTDDE